MCKSMNKVVSREEALSQIKSGQTLMVGDFLAVGTPEYLIDGILEANITDLTLISCTTGMPDRGCGKLVMGKRVKKAITSHIGTNPESGKQMNAGELEIEFSPQGTLAERIRCGGAGLGGVLTPTGLGTMIEEGKEKLTVQGQEYLLETALRGDVALVKAWRGDERGNLVYRHTARNFNPLCAMAADLVIAEVEELVPVGTLAPDEIVTPGTLVDMIVMTPKGGDEHE